MLGGVLRQYTIVSPVVGIDKVDTEIFYLCKDIVIVTWDRIEVNATLMTMWLGSGLNGNFVFSITSGPPV